MNKHSLSHSFFKVFLLAIVLMVTVITMLFFNSDSASASDSESLAPSKDKSYRAKVMIRTNVYSSPNGRRTGTLNTSSIYTGAGHYLLILNSREVQGKLWIKLRLPTRPNNSSGWVDANRFIIQKIDWRVEVKLSNRMTYIYKKGRLVRRIRSVVGADNTPTPKGLFSIYEKARQRASAGTGPWALHLTAHSPTLKTFNGGDGLTAIHGRSGSLLDSPLGTNLSYGCVRINNSQVRWLARVLPVGTPVLIKS
jgi:hypothetical protein